LKKVVQCDVTAAFSANRSKSFNAKNFDVGDYSKQEKHVREALRTGMERRGRDRLLCYICFAFKNNEPINSKNNYLPFNVDINSRCVIIPVK
jgi:hypothetical protein